MPAGDRAGRSSAPAAALYCEMNCEGIETKDAAAARVRVGDDAPASVRM